MVVLPGFFPSFKTLGIYDVYIYEIVIYGLVIGYKYIHNTYHNTNNINIILVASINYYIQFIEL